jgi:hypothetical protein
VDNAETPEKIKAYGNTIATILTDKPPTPLEHELVILDRATQKNDPKELKKLDPLIAEYKKIESALMKVVVPKSAVEQHVAFTESVSGMIYSITGISYIMTDPIKSLPGVSSYAENSQKFLEILRKYKSYFDTEGIIFNPDDNGYQFFNTL